MSYNLAPIARYSLFTFFVLLYACATSAADGVIEINQTCAVQTGCLPGDTAGFPVTINEHGSYQLTGSLILPDENTSGIEIGATNVGINMNQFGIYRTGCENTVFCTRIEGTGNGIYVPSLNFASRVSVKDGVIAGMGASGIYLGGQSKVAAVSVSYSAFGIIVAQRSIIRNSSATQNEDNGITVFGESVVSNSVANFNEGNGISIGTGSVVRHCVASSNGGNGIIGETGSLITDNTSNRNTGNGIEVSKGSTVARNSVTENDGFGIRAVDSSSVMDNTSFDNGGIGIGAYGGSLVQRNTVRDNTGIGLDLGIGNSVYRGNVVIDNGDAVVGGINRGDNYCAGTGASFTICP